MVELPHISSRTPPAPGSRKIPAALCGCSRAATAQMDAMRLPEAARHVPAVETLVAATWLAELMTMKAFCTGLPALAGSLDREPFQLAHHPLTPPSDALNHRCQGTHWSKFVRRCANAEVFAGYACRKRKSNDHLWLILMVQASSGNPAYPVPAMPAAFGAPSGRSFAVQPIELLVVQRGGLRAPASSPKRRYPKRRRSAASSLKPLP